MGERWPQGAGVPSLVLGEPVQRAVRVKVSKRFAAFRALAESSFVSWCRDVCRLVLVPATPATERALARFLAAVTLGMGGLYSSGLNVIAFIDFGNQFYGLRCLSAEIRKALEGNEPQGCLWP